jgi:hypothetical protein
MDRVILGDNQFFGVDHLSDEKARQKEQRFKDTREIIRVIDDAYDIGVRTFMCTTYARIGEICDHIRQNPTKYADFKIYPCMPYAHKYANAVTELGIVGTLKHYTGGNVASSLVKGGMAVVQRDAFKVMQLLVDTEMSMFRGMNIEVIFLQNVVTDLFLGLGMYEFFAEFAKYVKSKYGAEPGFITMNLPMLTTALEQVGITKPIICASINKIGFRVSGGMDKYNEVLATNKVRAVAMQVYAAGALRPRDALEYVCGINGIESILFGASTKAHIEQTYNLINSYSH